MKNLYCMKCGRQVNAKLGILPKKCCCGVEFSETNEDSLKKIVKNMFFVTILMLPLFVLIYFFRQYLRDSIILYTFVLVIVVVWFRIAETILVRIGLQTMTNIEIR